MTNKGCIVMATDGNYLPHAATTLASIAAQCCPESIEVCLLVDRVPGSDLERLKTWINTKGIDIEFIRIDASLIPDAQVNGHISIAAYFRLLLPQVLGNKVGRCLYLDCDLIVCGSLRNVFHTAMNGKPLAAAEDPYATVQYEPGGYFNSGVMLYDLDRVREFGLVERCLEALQNHHGHLRYWDQDILNLVLRGSWVPLHPRWNRQARWDQAERWNRQFVRFQRGEPGRLCTHQQLVEAVEDPAILHFTTASKPWHARCTHPLKHMYWAYRQDTPWRLTKRPRMTIKEQLSASLDKLWSMQVLRSTRNAGSG